MDILIVIGIVGFSIWYLVKNIRKQSKGDCSCDGYDMNYPAKEFDIDIE